MSSIHAEHLWNKSFILCLVNNLFLFIFYFAQMTILPIYIVNELGGSIGQAGLAMTLFMVSAIALRPFTGFIIEKIGVKKSLYIAETFFVLLSLVYIFIDDLNSLLIIRFLHGFWFSLLTTTMIPVVNDFIPKHQKGEGMGYFVMSVNLGIVLGPMIGLMLIQPLGYTTVTAILALIVLIGYAFCFTIPLPKHVKIESVSPSKFKLKDLFEVKTIPVAFMALLIAFSYASIMSYISIYAESKNLLKYASLFFAVFAISMMALRPFTGKLYDRKGPSYVIYPAVISFAVGLAVLSQIQSVYGLIFSAVLIGIGFGSAQPCLQTFAIQKVPHDRIGHASSTFYTFYDIGIAAGSFVLGLIIVQFDYSFAYLLCSVITLASLLFYWLVVTKPPKQRPS